LGNASRDTGQSRVPAPPASKMGMIGEGIGSRSSGLFVPAGNCLKGSSRYLTIAIGPCGSSGSIRGISDLEQGHRWDQPGEQRLGLPRWQDLRICL